MRYLVILLGALALGVYSSLGLHYYSVLAGRTKNEWARLGLSLPSMALFIGLPMFGCMFLLGAGPNPSSTEMGVVWFVSVFFCWIGTVWVYLIKNRRALESRLRPGHLSNTQK
jgi:hypothetical protein